MTDNPDFDACRGWGTWAFHPSDENHVMDMWVSRADHKAVFYNPYMDIYWFELRGVCQETNDPDADSKRIASLREDDTQPFYTSQEKFDQLHVDDTDTKPRRVDSGLFPKHDLADKMQADATKRESTAEAKCPKCNGDVYYHGLIRVECLTPKCENYRWRK